MSNTFTPDEIYHIRHAKDALIGILNLIDFTPFRSNNDTFADISKHNLFLSGGAIASLLQGETPKDFDIYSTVSLNGAFKTRLITEHYNFIADVSAHYTDYEFDGKLITSHAVTMKNNIQYVVMMSGTPEAIKSTFDYVHCTPHFSFADNKLYISKQQYDAIVGKKLIVNNPKVVTPKRTEKFISRGYKVQV